MKRKRFIVPGMMTTYSNLKKHTRERSQCMAKDFQTRWSNKEVDFRLVAKFCGETMLEEQPWKHYIDPAGNGKLRDWIEAITGDDFDDVLRWIYGHDLDTHRKWVEIDTLDQHPSRAAKSQEVKNEVFALFAADPDATQEEVAAAVGVSQSRVAKIIPEKGESPGSGIITIEQQSKLDGKSDFTIKKERKLQREHPQVWQEFLDGQHRSLHAACVAAGAVRVRTPVEQVLHWWQRCSEAEREELRQQLGVE